MGFVNQTYLQIALSPETKEFIKNRAEELGYKTISAFLVSSAKNHIKIQIDTSNYQAIAKEINLIGRNINSFVRRIHSDGIYSDSDIELLLSGVQPTKRGYYTLRDNQKRGPERLRGICIDKK